MTSPVTLEHRSLWFATIELRREGIVVSGWGWTGPVTERIPIEEVAEVEKWTVTQGPNFRLHTKSGRSPLFGRIRKGAKFWELALEKDDRFNLTLRH
ncbi:MAG: hypothetical protein ABEK84_07655 [Salinibacter sp.]